LIPQLLEPSELSEATEACNNCGNYLKERRKHCRITRPLKCHISKDSGTAIQGQIINISGNGALIKVKHWSDFKSAEKVNLTIYLAGESIVNESCTIEVSSQIKRLTADNKQLGVFFLSQNNP
jgi:c-di-GMP-binding flagellar brake protein YcgR